jgi:signal peptidase II
MNMLTNLDGPRPADAGPAPQSASGAHRHRWTFVAAALLGAAADQAGKVWAVAHLQHAPGQRTGLGPLSFELSRNPGAAFGFGRGLTPWITAFSLAVVIGLCHTGTVRGARSRIWALTLGLIAAGAAGNAVDRLVRSPGPGRGAVVDWIKVPFYGPVFNLADVFLRAGILLALGLMAREGLRGRRTG